MYALGGGGHGFGWWRHHHDSSHRRNKRRKERNGRSCDASSDSAGPAGGGGSGGAGFRFPLKQALTAGSLAVAGDTIAQVRERMRDPKNKMKKKEEPNCPDSDDKDVLRSLISHHDWLRALRMASYGFLLYGPGCYVWYQYLDRQLPQQTVGNLVLKVLLNQVVLGPCVIAVALAWNNLWLQKLSDLPRKYQKDFLPTLFYGFRFWIPVSALNFWVVPLQGRVAFMSLGSIFWNFVLSSTMST